MIEPAGIEREEPRLRLLDDGDVDVADERQPAAREPPRDRGVAGLAPCARRRIRHVAIIRIGLEQDALASRPLLQPVGARAHRILHHPVRGVLVGVHHFARHRRELVRREPPLEAVVRPPEPDLQREAVERAQAFERRVVVPRSALARRGERLVEADEVALEEIEPVRAHLGIEDPLEAVDVVLGHELARPALEGRIGREANARPQLDRVGAALIGHVGQRGGGIGNHARRTREIIVDVERIENAADHVERIGVVGRLRVESVLGNGKGDAQRLRHVGRVRHRPRQGGDQDEGQAKERRHRFTAAWHGHGWRGPRGPARYRDDLEIAEHHPVVAGRLALLQRRRRVGRVDIDEAGGDGHEAGHDLSDDIHGVPPAHRSACARILARVRDADARGTERPERPGRSRHPPVAPEDHAAPGSW